LIPAKKDTQNLNPKMKIMTIVDPVDADRRKFLEMVCGNSSLEDARHYCGKASFSIFSPIFLFFFLGKRGQQLENVLQQEAKENNNFNGCVCLRLWKFGIPLFERV
jgi:hypothetical protein